MSLSDHFNQRVHEAQNANIEACCARLLIALQKEIAQIKKRGCKGSRQESGRLQYRQRLTKSQASFKFDTWYHSGTQMEKLLPTIVTGHPALKGLYEFCAQPDNDFRIEYKIEKNHNGTLLMPDGYTFYLVVTITLKDRYETSTQARRYPVKPRAVPTPEPTKPQPLLSQPPRPLQTAALTKAQVAEYLRNLRNEDDKREFIELLGGTVKKPALRLLLKKPER